jgi:glycosyltransferase involved in cell wall biosynthesis
MHDTVDIIMGTYNGEKYVAQQIRSILDQTYPHIRLIIRDDASSDQTGSILQDYASRYPHKITLVPTEERLGIKGNFSHLLNQTTAPYVMFSDQDDVWYFDKVAKTLAKMKETERLHPQLPVLIHTDLKVVDQNLHPIHASFWQYSGISPDLGKTLNRLLVQNVVTGCTTMINRSLANHVFSIPNEALMHDWWIALIAASFGQINFIPEPTICYRQHGKNTLGAKQHSFLSHLKKGFKSLKEPDAKLAFFHQHQQQTEAFLKTFQPKLKEEQKRALQTYLNLPHMSFLKSRYHIFKHGFFKNGLIRNATYLLRKFPKMERKG